MNYRMLIGGILFDIESPLPIHWRPEERYFFYEGEEYHRCVRVIVHFVDQLPNLIKKDQYRMEGLRIGSDEWNQEIRVYNAAFMKGKPVYAVSVYKKDVVEVYFGANKDIWFNPNIRIWNLVHMERFLLDENAIVLHCSYLKHNNKAILFSAPSGTGKTTQAKLWERLYDAQIINGDKAIVMKKNDVWFACGYPFHGSADECLNKNYPIEAVVIIRQNPCDKIEGLSLRERIQSIYSETTVNSWDEAAVNKVLDILADLSSKVTVVRQQCTMKDEAAHTLYRYLKGV